MTDNEKYDALEKRMLAIGFMKETHGNIFCSHDNSICYRLDITELKNMKGIANFDRILNIALNSESVDQFALGMKQLDTECILDRHEKLAIYHEKRNRFINRLMENGYADIYSDSISMVKTDIMVTIGLMTQAIAVTASNGAHLIVCGMDTGAVKYDYCIDVAKWDLLTDMLCISNNSADLKTRCEQFISAESAK